MFMYTDKSVGKMAITTESGAKLILELHSEAANPGSLRQLRITAVGEDNGHRGLVDIYELTGGKFYVVDTLSEV